MQKIVRYRIVEEEEEIPENLEAFKQWEFSSGSTTGEDFKIFARLFKKYLKANLPQEAELANVSSGHYYVSGFVQKNGKFVYFSISDVRHFPEAWHKEILVRTAQHAKDYTGGPNGYTTLEKFRERVSALLA